MTKRNIIIGVVAVLLAAGASFAALQARPQAGPHAPEASRSEHNALDVSFAQMMIAHHKQAVEMAELAEDRAASPEVKRLASEIKTGQQKELETMSGWLASWNEPAEIPTTADHGMGGHDMGAQVPGMMAHEDMKRLQGLSGAAFDKAFLEMMIAHHEGAIEMARPQVAAGQYKPAKDLAAKVLKDQTDEIEQMRKLSENR